MIERLLTLDPACLNDDQRLDLLVSLDRLISRASARTEHALASLVDRADEKDWVREEIRCALRWSDGYTRVRCDQAVKLVTDLPEAFSFEESGELNPSQARALAESCEPLNRTQCDEVLERVLPRAGQRTLSEFKNSVTRAVHRVDPRTATKKHEDAKRTRDVSLRALPHGMAGIYSVHTALDAEAIMTRVNAAAAVTTPSTTTHRDDRLVGERRADALVNLVLGRECPEQQTQHGRRPNVTVLVPWDVAIGYSDAPGELVGYGPIPAGMCRDAMTDDTATFLRWVVSPLGQILDCSSTYVPSQALQDLVVARDRTCRMPGCNRKACTCEIDHRDDFNGHNTTEFNLQCLCCRHHHMKTETRWTSLRSYDGTIIWTSPTGRVYTKPPDDLPGYDRPDDGEVEYGPP